MWHTRYKMCYIRSSSSREAARLYEQDPHPSASEFGHFFYGLPQFCRAEPEAKISAFEISYRDHADARHAEPRTSPFPFSPPPGSRKGAGRGLRMRKTHSPPSRGLVTDRIIWPWPCDRSVKSPESLWPNCDPGRSSNYCVYVSDHPLPVQELFPSVV